MGKRRHYAYFYRRTIKKCKFIQIFVPCVRLVPGSEDLLEKADDWDYDFPVFSVPYCAQYHLPGAGTPVLLSFPSNSSHRSFSRKRK